MITLLPLVLEGADIERFQRDAERVRRNTHDAIREIQGLPLVGARLIEGVELADATPTPIAHRLGRPAFVFISAVRGATTTGRIVESRDGTYDRKKYLALTATGWGATITVDLLVI